MKPDLYRIPGPWRGNLAVATRPRGADWLEDEFSAWRQAGMDLVVSLLESDEAGQLGLSLEREAAEASGLRFVSYSIPDRGIPASTQESLKVLAHILGTLEQGKNVAIHCRQSIGRSGMMAAGTLILAGASPQAAVAAVSAARGLNIPETDAQLDWIRQLPSHRPVIVP